MNHFRNGFPALLESALSDASRGVSGNATGHFGRIASPRALQLNLRCGLTPLQKLATPHHDRVAGTIETVISQSGLDMLSGNPSFGDKGFPE
jgi:hypothetical protein